LAPLSPEDKELLADRLRKGDYIDVLDRVKKPRFEGGFDLHISIKPLQTFYAKVALLDLINSRVPEDKKITQFESIAAGDILLASSDAQLSTKDPQPGHAVAHVPPKSTMPSWKPSTIWPLRRQHPHRPPRASALG